MRRALSHRDFRLLWLSQALSTIGDNVVVVVLALYVNDIGTPTDVGIVLAANALPFAGLLLLGGVWADRLPRHKVMVATDVVRGGLHALLAVLIVSGDVPIWAIASIEALFGAAHAFFQPAYSGLLPQTLPEEEMQEAQAVTNLTQNVSGFVGPALGSALFLTAGAALAFAVDAATFFAGAALLLRVRPRERGEPPAARERLRVELALGWRELRSRPWALLGIAYFSLLLMFAVAPFLALGPAVAELGYDEAAVFGIMSAVTGAGAIVGSLIAVRWQARRPLFVAWFVMLLEPAAFAGLAGGLPLWSLVPLFAVGGAGFSLLIVTWDTTLAREIPPAALSRVSAYDWMGSMGLFPVGFLLAGPVSAAVGVRETLAAGAALAVMAGLAVAFARPIRTFQSNSGAPASVVDASA